MDINPEDVSVDQQPLDPTIDSSQVQIDQPNPDQGISASSQEISPDQVQVDGSSQPDYESAGQQIATGIEGAAQGVAGPLATGLELGAHKLGIDTAFGLDTSAEAMNARKEANPWIHGVAESGALAASMFTGVGEAGLLAKGAEHLLPEAATVLGKVGSAAMKAAIESGGIQAGDEISKAMLGQGDPEAPVSSALVNIGGAGLLGGLTGGMFNAGAQAGTKSLAAIENARMGDKASKLLTGMGAAAKLHAAGIAEEDAPELIKRGFTHLNGGEEIKYSDYSPGVKLYYSGLKKATNAGIDAATDLAVGALTSMIPVPGAGQVGAILSQKYLAPQIEKILNRPLMGAANKVVMPTIMYALSKGQTTGLFNAMNYATQVAKGSKAIANGVEHVFKATGQQSINAASEKDIQKLRDHIDEGGVNTEMQDSTQHIPPTDDSQLQTQPEGFAKGGVVSNPSEEGSLAGLYPTQNMMMNAAKGRMSTYLASMKPQKAQKLSFDREPDTRIQDRRYTRALQIAAAPLQILNDIKDGTLQTESVKHFTSMYPELHQHLSKKFTERIMNAQMDEEKPPYKTRLALSMFMGAELDSTMTPNAIQAAQTTFMKPQGQQGPQQAKTKKGTSNLGKSNASYKTASQAAEADTTSRD